MVTHHAPQTEIRKFKVLKEGQITLNTEVQIKHLLYKLLNKLKQMGFVTNRSLQYRQAKYGDDTSCMM